MGIINVSMGKGLVAEAPQVILSEGIGSCIVAALYDPVRRIGGLAHVMLPKADQRQETYRPQTIDQRLINLISGDSASESMVYQFGDSAIHALVYEMLDRGVVFKNITAKMAGGAKLFPSYEGNSKGIGQENIRSIKHTLAKWRIPLIAWDIAGSHGRSVVFHLHSGALVVRALGREDKEI